MISLLSRVHNNNINRNYYITTVSLSYYYRTTMMMLQQQQQQQRRSMGKKRIIKRRQQQRIRNNTNNKKETTTITTNVSSNNNSNQISSSNNNTSSAIMQKTITKKSNNQVNSNSNSNKSIEDFVRNYILPVRYRYYSYKKNTTTSNNSSYYYTHEQGMLILKRLPLFVLLAITLIAYPETAPFSLIRIHGPSMIPTMAADSSDVWIRTSKWYIKLRTFISSMFFNTKYYLQRGDLIGFAHPNSSQHVSCKRIIGLPGDIVQRYGQYVHLYIQQDPYNWGILWPTNEINNERHEWMYEKRNWDNNNEKSRYNNNMKNEMKRTVVVPDNHVWVEADCPGFGIDSRHFGPIPIEWIQGKIVAKVWPIIYNTSINNNNNNNNNWRQRPHPIPLDIETLMEYNVYPNNNNNNNNNNNSSTNNNNHDEKK